MAAPAAKRARVAVHGEGHGIGTAETENELTTLREVCEDIRSEFFDAVGYQMGSAHFFTFLPCGHGFDDHYIHRICDAADIEPDASDTEADSDDDMPIRAAKCPVCKTPFSRLCFRSSIGPYNPASKANANIIKKLRGAARESKTAKNDDDWQKHDEDMLAVMKLREWHTRARGEDDTAAADAYCAIGQSTEILRIAQNWQPGVWLIDKTSTKFRSGKTLLCRAFALYMHGYDNQSARCKHHKMTYCLGGCNITAILAERLSAPHNLSCVEAWVLAKVHLEDTLNINMPRKSVVEIAARFYRRALEANTNAAPTPFFDQARVRKIAAEHEIKKSVANRMLEFTAEYIAVFADTGKPWKCENWIT